MECVVHRFRLFQYTPRAIQCMAVSDDFELAVGRSDGSIEIWSTTELWFQKLVIPGSEVGSVESLLWLGKRLISSGLHGNIVEYDLSNGTTKISVDSYGGAVWCLALSPDHKQIAAGCEDGSVKIFETSDETISFERSFDKQEGRILCLAWHESGDVVVTGSVDVIRLWSIKTGHAIQRITMDREMKKVETIVWSLLVLSDYTVVSGDSFGRVQFWNGKHGTLLQSYHVHRADVLCLCRGPSESTVVAAGVDPRVLSFKLTDPYDPTSWVKGPALQKHTHDVRSMVVLGDLIVSGGVDTNLMAKSFSPLRDDFRRIYSFPSNKIVSIAPAAQLVLLQYPTLLEVWKMARIVDSDSCSMKVIAQEENPIKILQLKIPSSSEEHIKCSNISPCGRWIVYSTLSTCRLYQLHYNTEEGSVKMQKIRCSGLSPSNVIQFSRDSTYMISATTGHKLIITKLDAQAYTVTLVHSHSVKSHTTPIHLIATSHDTKYMATANLDSNVDIFSIKDMKHVGSLPRYPRIPTALSFHPETNDVNVVYDDLKIFEFSIKEMSYTPFTRGVLSSGGNFLHDLRNDASKKHSNVAIVTNILHICNQNKDVVLCVSREGLFIIEKPCGKKTEVSARFCRQFMPLLHCDVIDTSTLIAVERPLQDIWQQLPATLYQKKFGT